MPTITLPESRNFTLRRARICVREHTICHCQGNNCTAPTPLPRIYMARRYYVRPNPEGRDLLGSADINGTFCYRAVAIVRVCGGSPAARRRLDLDIEVEMGGQ